MILEGQLKPGDKLPSERELSERFSVGRTSVREALKALSSLGVIKRTKEGTFVTGKPRLLPDSLSYKWLLEETTIKEVFETRRLFEVGLAELAAQRATDEDLEAMESSLRQDNGDIHGFIKSDVAFHTALAGAVQNKVIYELYVMVQGLLFQTHKYYDLFIEQGHTAEVEGIIARGRRDHWELLEAIRNQDPLLARQLMHDHLQAIEEGILGIS